MVYILVVLYNKSLQDSDTLKALVAYSDLLKSINAFICIWDNSFRPSLNINDIDFFSKKFLFQYQHCPENKPLSYVYNIAIEKLIGSGNKYLVVLDHDSKIGLNYFTELKSLIELNNEADIILPVAMNKGVIISPAKFLFVKGIYFKKIKAGRYKGKL